MAAPTLLVPDGTRLQLFQTPFSDCSVSPASALTH